MKVTIEVPNELHPDSIKLVKEFSEAMAAKLLRNEQKYGWTNEWATNDWYAHCVTDMHTHIKKGDPLDVGIYTAFMWFHDWPTNGGIL